MDAGRREGRQVGRRTFLKLATGAGLATMGGLGPAPWVRAASDVTLSIWTGFPELVPFYKAVAEGSGKAHTNAKFTCFSTSLRAAAQKLSAAVRTGTRPDIYDIGSNISVKFTARGLLPPTPPQ